MKFNGVTKLLGDLEHELTDTCLADVKIIVGVKEFWVSSHVLGTRSPVFRGIFMREQQIREWRVEHVDPDNFAEFLHFLYVGTIDITHKNVVDLWELSDKYARPDLKYGCEKFLKGNLGDGNVLTIMGLAIKYGTAELEQICWHYVDARTNAVLHTGISAELLKQILRRPELNISEAALFNFLVQWAKANATDWTVELKHWLAYIAFGSMEPGEIIRNVRPLNILSKKQYVRYLEESVIKDRPIGRRKVIFPPDQFKEGPTYRLSAGRCLVTKTDKNTGTYDSVCITEAVSEGLWEWTLKLLNGSSICFGIAPSNIPRDCTENHISNGWFIRADTGKLSSRSPSENEYEYFIGENLSRGGMAWLYLDMTERTIKYKTTGGRLSMAFQNIPVDQPLCLVVLMGQLDDCVELISATRLDA